jgi:SAM-dependent methyltransferase
MTDQKSRSYYDDFSRRYDAPRSYGYHALIDRLELETILPFARQSRVLEVGCGTGLILEQLAQVAASAWGLDVSPGMAMRAKERGLNVVLGSATRIPFADGTFDAACSFKVFAHVPDVNLALSEILRVVRPGGVVAVDFYNRWSLRYLGRVLGGPRRISARRTEADVFTRWDSPQEIRRMVPEDARLIDLRGIRIITPAAFVHRIPIVRSVFARAEREVARTGLGRWGGFLVAILRKRESGSLRPVR